MPEDPCEEELIQVNDAKTEMGEEYETAVDAINEATQIGILMGTVCSFAIPAPLSPIGAACAALVVIFYDALSDAEDAIDAYHDARLTYEKELGEYQACLHKTKSAAGEGELPEEELLEEEDGLNEAEEYEEGDE